MQVRHGGFVTADVPWKEDVGDDEVLIYDLPPDSDPGINLSEVSFTVEDVLLTYRCRDRDRYMHINLTAFATWHVMHCARCVILIQQTIHIYDARCITLIQQIIHLYDARCVTLIQQIIHIYDSRCMTLIQFL